MVDSLGIGIELYKKEKKMGRIYVTGDIHSEPDRFNTENFPEQKEMTRDDYVIICGDFGLVWSEDRESKRETWWLDWLENKTYTTLFVDGNHENFTRLNSLPIEEWHGGRVHKIREHVIHLMRGEMFDLDGKMIFTFGGARSHDRENRIEHISWWEQEMPTSAEMERAIEALDKCGWEVDYVITHCAPKSVQKMVCSWYENDSLVSFLERVRTDLKFKRWYFGHYHIDRTFGEQFEALYNRIIPME